MLGIRFYLCWVTCMIIINNSIIKKNFIWIQKISDSCYICSINGFSASFLSLFSVVSQTLFIYDCYLTNPDNLTTTLYWYTLLYPFFIFLFLGLAFPQSCSSMSNLIWSIACFQRHTWSLDGKYLVKLWEICSVLPLSLFCLRLLSPPVFWHCFRHMWWFYANFYTFISYFYTSTFWWVFGCILTNFPDFSFQFLLSPLFSSSDHSLYKAFQLHFWKIIPNYEFPKDRHSGFWCKSSCCKP